jgi:hypothetical protein
MTEYNDYAEISCDKCEKIVAYVEKIPDKILQYGSTWCAECFWVIYNTNGRFGG